MSQSAAPPFRVGVAAAALHPYAPLQQNVRPVMRKMTALLSKLTPEKFEPLSLQMTDLLVENCESLPQLQEFVSLIFDKAIAEPLFAPMYAELCAAISKRAPSYADEDSDYFRSLSFKHLLANRCQREFEDGLNSVPADGMSADEAARQTRRFLGIVRFIGALFLKNMLVSKIIHACVPALLSDGDHPADKHVEAVCMLLSTVGKALDQPSAVNRISAYFELIESWSRNAHLASRLRFLCLDLVELRKRGWNGNQRPASQRGAAAAEGEEEGAQVEGAAAPHAAASASAASVSGRLFIPGGLQPDDLHAVPQKRGAGGPVVIPTVAGMGAAHVSGPEGQPRVMHADQPLQLAAAPAASSSSPAAAAPAAFPSEEGVRVATRICAVCFERPVSCYLVPCGHVKLCMECAQQVALCPFCRTAITGKLQAFM